MIVVFVVDTSPTMGGPASRGLTKLDVAKMAVEDFTRAFKKNRQINPLGRNASMIGQFPGVDHFLLLSTSRQHASTSSCAAGGRLLVGFDHQGQQQTVMDPLHHSAPHDAFQRELKSLKVADTPRHDQPWPEHAGGAPGLNAALSTGLQLLGRYRLQSRETENFGMGRLPNAAMMLPNGTPANNALQPACLILLTDGACLRHSKQYGGGSLQIHLGSNPLKEFNKQPLFRWDQRFFIQAVGAREGLSSKDYLHKDLLQVCQVMGGSHWCISSNNLAKCTDTILKRICPLVPRELPLPDPLFQRLGPAHGQKTVPAGSEMLFANGGPVVSFQLLEGNDLGAPTEALLLYVGSSATTILQQGETVLSQPLFCIPESYFPSKKLDKLPPREIHPVLFFSKYPANLGLKSFDAVALITTLLRYDQIVLANKSATNDPVRYLHRDVYVCNWIPDSVKMLDSTRGIRQEYYPVIVKGAGRPQLSDDGENFLNIGILHVPAKCSNLGPDTNPNQLATLTMLPPEPHVLLPLLMRAAEAEHVAIKKMEKSQKTARPIVPLDDHWRSEFRAYQFRLPPYYQHVMKRCLRLVLPPSVHSLLNTEGTDLASQCFSKACSKKIRDGEQLARDQNEYMEHQEASLRRNAQMFHDRSSENAQQHSVGYGQYDPRSTVESYLSLLRSLPPPQKQKNVAKVSEEDKAMDTSRAKVEQKVDRKETERTALEALGDLPANCLMAYYESRRRWLFGGSSLAIRGLHADGIRNDGTNSQRCLRHADGPITADTECPLSIAGIGVSTLNNTTTHKMGEFRDRLLFSRSPIVGYGSNDSAGVSATTAVDGSPTWSVDDDALPLAFFDPVTGDFADSIERRMRSKLTLSFGNPYRDKRADSLVPQKYLSQLPPIQRGRFDSVDSPGSPPHESFDSVEEGEAIFSARRSPSPKREDPEELPPPPPPPKRPRRDSMDLDDPVDVDSKQPAPAPKPAPAQPKPKPPVQVGSVVGAKGTSAPAPRQPPKPARPAAPPLPPPGKISRSNSGGKGPPPPKPSARPRPPGKGPPPRRTSTSPAPKPPPMGDKRSPTTLPKTKSGAPNKPPVGDSTSPPTAPKPKAPQGPAETPDILGTDVAVPKPIDYEAQGVKPDVDLPPGWISAWSKSQKRWYFFDKKTNTSVWKWPPP